MAEERGDSTEGSRSDGRRSGESTGWLRLTG